ncbi:GNAT family N-acetyltransferase [Hoyosella subflava]|uniref:Acetyltransferase-like protein n=1 Tax=Hoyosella subflava (strain DSM 45089 / JCM 17490 / NBRC 109087 / DQS3-9A1) TaxID=443218 RepID=F6ELP3_HOYSD|nr:GNAT family N-acetyltransferase [Hoyosella subflava]AEF41491.1 Acetyltransferase-like protein [Hoyosella subflava DQS3-9A1]
MASDNETAEVTVKHNAEQTRFEIWVGDEMAGFTEYRPRPELRAFVHTEIQDKFGGRGFAMQVIREALDATRNEGQRLLPYCPAVQKFLAKNPDYVAMVPEERRAEFDL